MVIHAAPFRVLGETNPQTGNIATARSGRRWTDDPVLCEGAAQGLTLYLDLSRCDEAVLHEELWRGLILNGEFDTHTAQHCSAEYPRLDRVVLREPPVLDKVAISTGSKA